jgi:N-carbamoyl-L-amino-acid hydrolase
MTLPINAQRLLDDLQALAQIGATPDGGVSRPALSPADVQGRNWFRARIEAAGLDVRSDGAGNLSAVLPAADPGAPTLLAGSHLDTVPNGGRFDGALGVLAALEALRTLQATGRQFPVQLEATPFTDEEGSVAGFLGSRALTGHLQPAHLEQARGGPDALQDGLRRLDITRHSALSAGREPATLAGFVELHVEQGTRLEDAGIDLGVVTTIVGIRSFRLRFQGQAAHAGTTPMDRRRDALWGAASFVQEARDLVTARFSPGVVNCGNVAVEPGAYNIVPGAATLFLEFRHGDEEILEQMQESLLDLAQRVARRFDLQLSTAAAGQSAPAPMDETMIETVEQAAATLDLSHTRLVSFAGHDAQILSAVTPTALLFVPSVDGVSHNPREFTRDQDVVNGANVVLHTLLRLATG